MVCMRDFAGSITRRLTIFLHRRYGRSGISVVSDGVKYPSIDPITGGEFVRAEEGSSLALAVSGTVLRHLKD